MAALYNVLNITHAVEQNFSQQKKRTPQGRLHSYEILMGRQD